MSKVVKYEIPQEQTLKTWEEPYVYVTSPRTKMSARVPLSKKEEWLKRMESIPQEELDKRRELGRKLLAESRAKQESAQEK